MTSPRHIDAVHAQYQREKDALRGEIEILKRRVADMENANRQLTSLVYDLGERADDLSECEPRFIRRTPGAPGRMKTTITLSEYQRANLTWLLCDVIGYGGEPLHPGLRFLNTGDWIGDVALALQLPFKCGATVPDVLDEPDQSYVSARDTEGLVAQMRHAFLVSDRDALRETAFDARTRDTLSQVADAIGLAPYGGAYALDEVMPALDRFVEQCRATGPVEKAVLDAPGCEVQMGLDGDSVRVRARGRPMTTRSHSAHDVSVSDTRPAAVGGHDHALDHARDNGNSHDDGATGEGSP